MVDTAIILQPGKVELHAMPDHDVPPFLRMMRPAPFQLRYQDDRVDPQKSLELETFKLIRHGVSGFHIDHAYWPEGWSNAWGIEELLRWEGREDEIRRNQYYADYFLNEQGPQENPDAHREIQQEPLPSSRWDGPVVVVLPGPVRGRTLDAGADGDSSGDHSDLHRRELPGGSEEDSGRDV